MSSVETLSILSLIVSAMALLVAVFTAASKSTPPEEETESQGTCYVPMNVAGELTECNGFMDSRCNTGYCTEHCREKCKNACVPAFQS